MSLIPSESASFPDLLGRGLDASRKSKWRIPEETVPSRTGHRPPLPTPVKPTVNVPPLVSLEGGELAPFPAPAASEPATEPVSIPEVPHALMAGPVESKGEQKVLPAPAVQPLLLAASEPAIQRLPEPQPTLQSPLEEKPALSESVRSSELILPGPVQKPVAQPSVNATAVMAPLHFTPAASAADGEDFEFPQPTGWPVQRRRRARLVHFVLWELFALSVLAVAVVIGLDHRLPNDPISTMAKIVTIVCAIAVGGIPILFYGLPETLPRSNR